MERWYTAAAQSNRQKIRLFSQASCISIYMDIYMCVRACVFVLFAVWKSLVYIAAIYIYQLKDLKKIKNSIKFYFKQDQDIIYRKHIK